MTHETTYARSANGGKVHSYHGNGITSCNYSGQARRRPLFHVVDGADVSDAALCGRCFPHGRPGSESPAARAARFNPGMMVRDTTGRLGMVTSPATAGVYAAMVTVHFVGGPYAVRVPVDNITAAPDVH